MNVLASDQLPKSLTSAIATLQTGDFYARWDAVKVITRYGEVSIAPLVDLLQNLPEEDGEDDEADWELPWFIARALGMLEDSRVIPVLINLIKFTSNADVIEMAAAALVNFGTAVIDPLSQLLSHPNLRQIAVQSLAKIHHPQVISTLLPLVHDSDPVTRSEVMTALSHFDHPDIPLALLNALTDPVAKIRQAAIAGLGYYPALLHSLNLIERIQPLLWDTNLEVCQQAANTLSRFGTDESIVVLSDALYSASVSTFLKVEIVRSLAWIERIPALECLQCFLQRVSQAHSSIPGLQLVNETTDASEFTVCQEIVAVLGRIENCATQQQATAILIQLLQTGHPIAHTLRGKQSIAQSLGQLNQAAAIDPLIQLLQDADVSVRFHAIAALKQLNLTQPNSDIYQRLQHLTQQNITAELQAGIAIALQEWQS